MPSVLRSLAVFSFISAVALMSAPGCSQQGEGERCDEAKNGDLDCDDGLVCVQASQLRDKTGDRCCPVTETDRTGLCTPSGVETETPEPSDGGTSAGGAAGAGGVPAAGGTSAGQGAGGVPGSSGSGTTGGVPSVDGGAPAAGATTGGAGSPSSNGGQGGAD